MKIKHIRIRNYESDLFMYLNCSCSVYHQCLSTDDQISEQIIIYIINYKLFFLLLQKNMNTLGEFFAGFLTDLHCRKWFLVLGTMLVNLTVEINRHEQCDFHDPASILKQWCSLVFCNEHTVIFPSLTRPKATVDLVRIYRPPRSLRSANPMI